MRTDDPSLRAYLIAFGLLLPAEIVGVLWVRGYLFGTYLGSFTTAPGLISLLMFLVFAAMPALVSQVGRGRAGRSLIG